MICSLRCTVSGIYICLARPLDLELEIELTSTATQCVASTWGWYICTYGIPLYYINIYIYICIYIYTLGWGQPARVGCVGIDGLRGPILDPFLPNAPPRRSKRGVPPKKVEKSYMPRSTFL